MTSKLEQGRIEAELTAVDELLATISQSNVASRIGLEERRDELRQTLEELKITEGKLASVALKGKQVSMQPDIIAEIAVVCHEANRAICEAAGDFSQKSWREAADWQRESALRGVQFALDNPNASADAQHNAWLNDKLNDGWVYGPVKNADAKLHPCICGYDELPFEQRVKDHVFKAIVKAMRFIPV